MGYNSSQTKALGTTDDAQVYHGEAVGIEHALRMLLEEGTLNEATHPAYPRTAVIYSDNQVSDWSVLGLVCILDTPEVPDVGVNDVPRCRRQRHGSRSQDSLQIFWFPDEVLNRLNLIKRCQSHLFW